MSPRALLCWRPPAAVALAGAAIALLALAACAGERRLSGDASAQLYARGLHEISDLYLEPVSSRRLALAGAARLARLDNKIAVSDNYGPGFADALSLSADGRDIAMFAAPPETASGAWGETIAQVVAGAKQASPRLAAMPQEAVDKAVFDGMTAALDHFSRYLTPEVARDQRAARDGFGGIGVTFDSTNDAYRVTAVTPNGPADRAGIRPDDRILAIDRIATAGRAREEVIHQLRGPVGSPITVSLLHPGNAQPRELHLQRALVVIPTVTMTRDGDVAIFQVTSFNHSTTTRIAEGLAEMQRQNGGRLAGVVLDLRSNPGGLLDQAVSLADLFIRNGPIIATVGRHPAARQSFQASGFGIAPQVPVAVLINGGSASAAEIVAAALQDAGRAVVIGSSSYGKGTVQTVLHLPNGGDLIVTWARLVAPAGYLLQRHGVVPTICTADLGDGAQAVESGLRRAAAGTPAATQPPVPRAALDEPGWAALRQSCPAQQTRPTVDLKLAQRLLADPRLYSQALHSLATATRLAERTPVGAPSAAALTEAERALFSSHH